MAVEWTERDGVAVIAPLLVQPIAPDDIAAVLDEIATGAPQGRMSTSSRPDDVRPVAGVPAHARPTPPIPSPKR